MLQLIEHIIRIASRRDRTEINSALVDAMRDVFDPAALAVHRCYPAAGSMIVFTCAGLGPGGQFSHSAYLPERRYCEPIDHDPLLQRCQKAQTIVREARADGADAGCCLWVWSNTSAITSPCSTKARPTP